MAATIRSGSAPSSLRRRRTLPVRRSRTRRAAGGEFPRSKEFPISDFGRGRFAFANDAFAQRESKGARVRLFVYKCRARVRDRSSCSRTEGEREEETYRPDKDLIVVAPWLRRDLLYRGRQEGRLLRPSQPHRANCNSVETIGASGSSVGEECATRLLGAWLDPGHLFIVYVPVRVCACARAMVL